MPRRVELTLLTQADCAFCDDAKQILDRLSQEYPLAIETHDLASAEGRELAVAGGVMFAPGILIEGEPFSYGRPSERKLRRELGRRLQV